MAIPQVTEHSSGLVGVRPVYGSSLVVALYGHASNDWVDFFCVFIALVRIEAFDLTGKFRLNNGYCDLSPVRNVEPWHACTNARFFQVAT